MKSISHRNTLLFFDGVQIFDAIDAAGQLYIAVLIRNDPAADTYMVVEVSEPVLNAFVRGEIDLKSVLLDRPDTGWYIASVTDFSAELPLEQQKTELSDCEFLPDAGFVLPGTEENEAGTSAKPQVHPATEYLKKCLKAGAAPEEAFADTTSVFGAADAQKARINAREEIHKIYTLRDPPILADNELAEWYPGPTPNDRFWPSLERYLRKARGWTDTAIDDLDKSSTQVLARVAPPGMKEIRTRGLVVGYVQSGKTANFTALIAKAADVNYRLFVVLSGVTNSLRNQTQQRLERELVAQVPNSWITLTKAEHDFSGAIPVSADAVLNPSGGGRVLAVLKKNPTRLRRFIEWLEGAHPDNLRNCAIMVIDDEADQASINTSRNESQRTKINGLIVRMLKGMPKLAYVGYTATPFANVLNEPPGPESLYPSNFIVTLPKPETYFGPERIFGSDRVNPDEDDTSADGLDMIREISVEEAVELRAGVLDGDMSVPPSLETALRYFIMATAARLVRESKPDFSTMMIHTTQSVAGHHVLSRVVSRQLKKLRSEVDSDGQLASWRTQWEDESTRVTPDDVDSDAKPVSFSAMRPLLATVVDSAETIVDNYVSPARLNFSQKNRTIIVIGGNTLARGLTVEGLVTSYFLRTSTAYDTLMQMGRWFGFRKGYEDLPRIWMTDELRDYFFDLATVEEEFRAEVRRYTLGLTPRDFGPRIRTHAALMVTSRLKMQAATKAWVSYGGLKCQTILFHHQNLHWLNQNENAARKLLVAADETASTKSNTVAQLQFHDVPAAVVLRFFEEYQFHPQSRELKGDLVTGYIGDQNKHGALLSWDVVVVGQADHTKLGEWTTPVGNVGLINRSRIRESGPDADVTANIKSLMSKADIVSDIPADKVPDLDAANYADLRALRMQVKPKHGLLLIYPISKDSVPTAKPGTKSSQIRDKLDAVATLIGLGIVLPEAEVATPQAYVTVDMSKVPREEPEYPQDEADEDAA